jgi:hypothetical protein
MALTPILPVLDDESLTSYMTRVAMVHARLSLNDFLALIEVPRSSLISPRMEDVQTIGKIVGLSVDTLLKTTFLSHGGRLRSIRGHEVNTEFTNYDQVTFCPACLLEDVRPESPSGGFRIGRLNWRINHVRACARHGIALCRQKVQVFSDKLQDMSIMAPDDAELQRMVDCATPLGPSDLQEYLEARIRGEDGPEWLDMQPLDEAARACEMLGIIITNGSHCNLYQTSEADWHRAGHTGFGFAAKGEQGIREGLGLMLARFHDAGLSGGPQMAFGRLYQWLQFPKTRRPRGPIRDVVREFLLDNFSFEPGIDLFGKPVAARRVHTLGTLSMMSGLHRKTLAGAIVLSGLAKDSPDVSLGVRVFDAAAAEDLVHKIKNSVSVLDLPKMLNCNRTQAQQMVRTGMIKRIVDSENSTQVLKAVPVDEARAFLSRLLGRASKVDVPSDGMMDIVTAATVSRWPFMDILDAVLSGTLTKVEVVDPELKFKGVLVHPDEIVNVMKRAAGDGLLELKEAAQLLDWPDSFATTIVHMKTPDGVDYIPKQSVTNAKGRLKFYVRIEDLQLFRSTHVSLAEHAASVSMAPRGLLARLRARGIAPLPTNKKKPVWIYRLADMPA